MAVAFPYNSDSIAVIIQHSNGFPINTDWGFENSYAETVLQHPRFPEMLNLVVIAISERPSAWTSESDRPEKTPTLRNCHLALLEAITVLSSATAR